MKGKVRIGAAEASDEVVFQSVDGTFWGIAAMDARWDELEVDVFLVHVLFGEG
jgi:hypothetical protein